MMRCVLGGYFLSVSKTKKGWPSGPLSIPQWPSADVGVVNGHRLANTSYARVFGGAAAEYSLVTDTGAGMLY